MNRKPLLLLFSVFYLQSYLTAQIGGRAVFETLNLSPSARVTAMGGNLITVQDKDLALAFINPALLNPDMDQSITFNHNFHIGSLQHGYAAFGFHNQSLHTTLHAGIQYFKTGDLQSYDEFEQPLGTTKANEYILTLGAAYPLYDRMTLGFNLKAISSRLADYQSFGIAGDLAAFYQVPESNFTATFLLRNIGSQIDLYASQDPEKLPFEIQVGISRRLKYLPFRFSIISRHLQTWNISYDDPDATDTNNNPLLNGFETRQESSFSKEVDNFFRHFVFNGELLLGKYETFVLRFGYDHLRRQEMQLGTLRSMAGFSLGFGFKVSSLQIDFGHAFYHLAGGTTHFSFTTNLSSFRK